MADRPWTEQVLWALDRLERMRRLVAVVHARAATSPAVGAWHERFHALADDLLADGFRDAGAAEEDLAAMTRVGVFVLEGLLTHPQPEQERRAVVELLTAGLRG
ncbi:unannotated protein [freshwater metagenome]|uniref:Unannotated protein n=1 Tax=freshwater metagenome TaxID=449393 RepID=A0A6J7LP93_9ZZZZ